MEDSKYIYMLVINSRLEIDEHQRSELNNTFAKTKIIVQWSFNPNTETSIDMWTNDPKFKKHKLA